MHTGHETQKAGGSVGLVVDMLKVAESWGVNRTNGEHVELAFGLNALRNLSTCAACVRNRIVHMRVTREQRMQNGRVGLRGQKCVR